MANTNIMEPFSQHGTSYKSFILVFFLGSFGIAISFAILSIPPTEDFQHYREFLILFTQSFGGFFAVSLAILSLWFIFRYKHWVRKGLVTIPVRKWPHSRLQLVLYTDHNGNEKPVHSGHSSWLQIVLFGIGSVAYLISVLVQVVSQNNVDKIQVAKTLITLTCCILFIKFLKLYNGVFLKNTTFFHYSIAIMVGAGVCEWITISIRPFWEHAGENVTMATVLSNSSISMSDYTEGDHFEFVFDTIHSFLQPFFVEFLSMSASCLFELRKTMRVDGHYHIEYTSDDSDIESNFSEDISRHVESSRIIGTNEDHSQNYQAIEFDGLLTQPNKVRVSLKNLSKKCRKYGTTIVVVISACTSVFYVVVCSIVLVPVTPFYKDNLVIEIIHKINNAFVCVPLIVLLMVALYKLNKMKICMRKSRHFTSTDYLLVFASSALFVYNILRIIALIGLIAVHRNTDTVGTIFQILFWAFSIVHIWGQTQLIMTVQYINRSEQRIPRIARFTLIYLMSYNASLWLCDSIQHKWVENGKNIGHLIEMVTLFGESQTRLIMLIFLPIWDIYCFHSAVVAYRSLKSPNH